LGFKESLVKGRFILGRKEGRKGWVFFKVQGFKPKGRRELLLFSFIILLSLVLNWPFSLEVLGRLFTLKGNFQFQLKIFNFGFKGFLMVRREITSGGKGGLTGKRGKLKRAKIFMVKRIPKISQKSLLVVFYTEEV